MRLVEQHWYFWHLYLWFTYAATS